MRMIVTSNLNDTILLRYRIQRILNIALANDTQVPNDVDSRGPQHIVIGVR